MYSLNLRLTAVFGAVGLLSSGCTALPEGARPQIGLGKALPRVINQKSIDTTNCMETRVKGFDPGWVLFFLPGFQKTNSTRFNEGCWAAKTANTLISSPVIQHKALAVAMYEGGFDEAQKKMVDTELARQGTTMDRLREQLPRQVRTESDGEGVSVYYKVPGEEFEVMHHQPYQSSHRPDRTASHPVATP